MPAGGALPVLLGSLCILGAIRAGSGAGPGPGGGSGSGGGPGSGPSTAPPPIEINPGANTFLGAVVALRSRGSGLFGCGPRTQEGLVTLDALEALVDAVNSERQGYPSIPKGVSLGVRVFDHCGRPRVAVSQLAVLLPELGPGGPPPGPGVPTTTADGSAADSPAVPVPPPVPGLRTVGVLDGAGLTRTDADADLEVRHALAEAMVPVAAIDSSHLVPAVPRAQALVGVLQRLEWRRFVVVRGADAYSDELWQAVAQLAAGLRTADFCVDSVETFVFDGQGQEQRAHDGVLDAVSDAAVSGLPVVVLLPRSSMRPFLEALRDALFEADMPPAAPAALMLLLSDLVAREDAALLPQGATVYSLATSSSGSAGAQALEALLPAGANDTLEGALRADALLAAAQPVLTFALALKRSWRDKCPGKLSGACPPWAAMSRPEFLSAYFAPLAAAMARGERVQDSGWDARWAELLLPPRELTLYRYRPGGQVRAVLTISSISVSNNNSVASTSSVVVVDEAFHPEEVGVCATRPSVQSAAECERTCLPLQRPSRTAGGRRIESWANYQDNHLQRDATADPTEPVEVLDTDTDNEPEQPDFLRLVESPQGVYVLLLLPLRQGDSDTALDCPAGLDEDGLDVIAIRRVEAFLWALQRLNQQLLRDSQLPQLQVGALLADSCSSSLRAMALSARLRPLSYVPTAHDKAERVLAVVNALPLPAARLAADVLSERNVTSIATSQLLHTNASSPSPFQLQVDLPLARIADAMVESLRHLGWSYVSVVHVAGESNGSRLADHSRGKDMFLEAAARAGICVALEATLGDLGGAPQEVQAQEEAVVARLLGARAGGARGVVVWADAAGLRRLFRAVTRAIAQGSLRREDVFWMVASPRGDARDILNEFGNVLAGAAVFSPQRRAVAEFQHFLRQEVAAGGGDGRGTGAGGGVTGTDQELRWLRRYQEQCGGGVVCAADEPGAVAGDWALVQSVQALGAVIAQLNQATCTSERPWTQGGDVCLSDSGPKPIDAALADALRWTASPRADGPVGAEFRFSSEGGGLLSVDVDNFRRRPGAARSRSLGDVHFQRVGTFLNGKLTSFDGSDGDGGLLAYKDSGEEIRVATLTSQCGGNLGSCHHCRQQRGRPNSALGDWIVVEPPAATVPAGQQKGEPEPSVYVLATLDVHEPSANPLRCGQEINHRGVEQLEAFLWAVDQINSNFSGLRVGAVAVDTCGSAARTARLVSELLVGPGVLAGAGGGLSDQQGAAEASGEAAGAAGTVVALLAAGGTAVATPALEAAAALGLPGVAPTARGPPPHRKTHPPYPLQLGPSNKVLASGVVSLLLRLGWRCGSVLYLQDAMDYEETFRQVESLALAANLSLTGKPVPASARASSAHTGSVRQALLEVRERQASSDTGNGAHSAHSVAVLLLPAWCVDAVLRTAAALEDEGLWAPAEVLLVAVGREAEGAFLAHSRQTLGGLLLRARPAAVPEFDRYFRSLSLDANQRNPWFGEFWSSVFHCRGSACRGSGRGARGLDAYHMQPSSGPANIINSVLAVGHALQTVRRELCPGDGPGGSGLRSPCRSMAGMLRVRARMLEVAPRMAFVGAGLNAVAFSATGENTNVAVEVLNVQVSAHSKAATLVSVGELSAGGALTGLRADTARAYRGTNREPVDLLNTKAFCPGVDPPTTASPSTTAPSATTSPVTSSTTSRYLMELPGTGVEGQPAPALLVLLAAHAPARGLGAGPFHCGDLDVDELCHLAGAMYAVHRANTNDSLLHGQGPKLGLIAVDTCGQPGRAYSSLFALLSQSERATVPVAALVMDGASAVEPMVGPLLHMQAIPFLNASDHRPHRHTEVQAGTEATAHALLDLSVALQRHASGPAVTAGPAGAAEASAPGTAPATASAPAPLVVLHGSAPHARALARRLESASLERCPGAGAGAGPAHDHHAAGSGPGPGCLSAVLPMPTPSTASDTGSSSRSRSGPLYLLSTLAPSSVVILALDSVEDVRALLLVAQSPLVPRLVFLTALRSATPLRADGHSVLSLVADATVLPPSANPRRAGADSLETAFTDWLQNNPMSGVPATWANSLRASSCDPEDPDDLDRGLWTRADIMQAVERVARGVRWSADNASRPVAAADLPARVALFMEEDKHSDRAEPSPPPKVDTFRIWRADEALGSWSPQGGLTLSTEPGLLALDELSVSGRPTLFHNLQYAWAVSLLVLALLGILLTLLTAVFFLSAAAVSKTPISGGAGTSVLGYLILLGLLLLHGAVLALVLAPGDMTCGARRILPALAYAIIFSAMFLKVLTTWQVCDRKGGVVRPLMLVVRALGLAAPQVLVSAGWLVLVPPAVHMAAPAPAPGPGEAPAAQTTWQCDAGPGSVPGEHTQAPHVLLSLAYTCLLMVATAVLALLCSSKEELLEEGTMLRQESRWILVSAVAVAVQLGCWGLAAVAAPSLTGPLPAHADMLAASVHALAAATLLLCLFLPKLRLYLRLRRDARNTAAIAASAAARSAASRSQPIYGISHFQRFGGKLNPAFDAPSTDMSLGESASQSASDHGSHSASDVEGDYNDPLEALEPLEPMRPLAPRDPLDPTQVVPSSLYSIDMFSSQDSGSQGVTDIAIPAPVIVAMTTGDGRGTVRGTLRGAPPSHHGHGHHHHHLSLFGTVRGMPAALRGAQGGTLRSVQGVHDVGNGGTVRSQVRGSLHGTIRGPHFLPGSNEFTAPHRSSSMLLLPGQESISYM
ncbi:Metabotropic glutamate receptor 5 [Frankliniella fusca]|uniref:Metabotropic glutamate receptor 5 n=1 Tax=Frankliniella fusca TaxID=407009 RepID=A0AAE1HG61_9NEOP|nr:Metabotropic glutamate receptor 5 [Frankliniella fusca]